MIRHELVAFPGSIVDGLSPVPGDVTLDALSGAQWLHHAPGRWLVVEGVADRAVEHTGGPVATAPGRAAADDVPALAAAAVAAGNAAVFDVEGKFHRVDFDGEDARAVLGATVNLDAVLPVGRRCAAVPLFDCPAVLLRTPSGYVAWVTASYVADFTAATERARDICAKL